MLKKEEISEDQFVILNGQIGIIQNVENARESRRTPTMNDPAELAFEILFIETDTTQQFCENSPGTDEIKLISTERAQILMEEKILNNSIKITVLKKENLVLREKYKDLFLKDPPI
ncbi:MAG TPA: hypothetical protein VK153_00660 [Candidatus Paceibacterota bacterium]|nr:hypothetical protein [Candidatus Paceibacterota bacterium]